MSLELSYEALQEMKKVDYIKAFKNKAIWKKANAVIVLVDYRLDGKKTTVAIPFKKPAEMKKKLKEIKQTKGHLMKKTGGGSIHFENSADGMLAVIELQMGGLAPELLQIKGEELFAKIKATLKVLMAEAAEVEMEAEENTQTATAGTNSEKPAADDQAIFNVVKGLMLDVSTAFKDKIKTIVVPNIQAKKVEKEDLSITESMIEKIDQMEERLEEASEALRQKIDEKVQQVRNLLPNLEKIKLKLKELLGVEEEDVEEEEAGSAENLADKSLNKEFEKLFKEAQKALDHSESNVSDFEKELKNAPKTTIPSGSELINGLV